MEGCEGLVRTIYSKYSNERAERFCIRTDIVELEDKTKAVYKHALKAEGQTHIENIRQSCIRLSAAYTDPQISFCPCDLEETSIRFPFLEGETLQDILERKVFNKERDAIGRILTDYRSRILKDGGKQTFYVTEEFTEVFGNVSPAWEMESAKVSDIDMIFSNILVERQENGIDPENLCWNVIDYEWTFDFPVPKDFLIYRAFYFAYYQVLHDTEWTFEELMRLAQITEPMQQIFKGMEEHFQNYLGKGALPVRNMQRKMGTRIFMPPWHGGSDSDVQNGTGKIVPESEWIKVRKLQFQVDRQEYQDGSVIFCGWAFAQTRDGRTLPVDIRIVDERGNTADAEITRLAREDVAKALRIRKVTVPLWGFNCVWLADSKEKWKAVFSLGNCKKTYESDSERRR